MEAIAMVPIATQTFWIEPTETVAYGLRRYAYSTDESVCPGKGGYHNALLYLGETPVRWVGVGRERVYANARETKITDKRWPKVCYQCEYPFSDDDRWQDWEELIYWNPATNERFVLHSNCPPNVPTAPPGATWDAWWLPDGYRGADGIALMVRLPDGHDWIVDSEASNCTRKGDPRHKCWVRHGDPQSCHVTVDKIGDTCAAGAGSIQSAGYHGFLTNGVLTAG